MSDAARKLVNGVAGTRETMPAGSTRMGRQEKPHPRGDRLRRILTLADFEEPALRRLPRALGAYVVGGAEQNLTVEENRRAFARTFFRPGVGTGVNTADTRTELFGSVYAAPFGVAPMGALALASSEGDLAAARGAADSGIAFSLSGAASTPLEAVLEANPETWFQAYLTPDLSQARLLLDRVAAAGVKVLVVTLDVPVVGNRENSVRAGFSLPLQPSFDRILDAVTHPRWSVAFIKTVLSRGGLYYENRGPLRGPSLLALPGRPPPADRGRGALSWDDIQGIRRMWRGALVLKGILRREDAIAARDLGADGIIVSNHGGRQLDGAVSSLEALAGVGDLCSDTFVLMIDGGVRRGADVAKAIALGARMAWVGRPFFYATALAGRAGVAHASKILQSELARDLVLLGADAPSRLDRVFLHQHSTPGWH